MKSTTLFRAATLGLAWLAVSPQLWAQQKNNSHINIEEKKEVIITQDGNKKENTVTPQMIQKRIQIHKEDGSVQEMTFWSEPNGASKKDVSKQDEDAILQKIETGNPSLPLPNTNKEVIIKKEGDVETLIEITTSHDNNTVIEKRVEIRTNGDIKEIGKNMEEQIELELKNANVKEPIERKYVIIRNENGTTSFENANKTIQADKITVVNINACTPPPSQTFLGVQTADLENGQQGVLVEKVYEHSAAQEAGLRVGDILTKVNGQPIQNSEQLRELITSLKPGDKVDLEFLDKGANNTVRNSNVALKERATRMYAREWSWNNNGAWSGTDSKKDANFDPCQKLEALRNQAFLGVYLDAWGEQGGATVKDIIANTSADKSKLQAKDIIIKLNKTTINNYKDLMAAVKAHKAGDKVSLQVTRNGKNLKVSAIMGSLGDRDPIYIQSLEKMCDAQQPTAPQETAKVQTNTNAAAPGVAVLNLFPNPVTDVLNIRFKGEVAPITISVFNLEGKVILQQEKPDFAGELTHTIQLNNEAAGLYIVSVKQKDKIYTQQFVIGKP